MWNFSNRVVSANRLQSCHFFWYLLLHLSKNYEGLNQLACAAAPTEIKSRISHFVVPLDLFLFLIIRPGIGKDARLTYDTLEERHSLEQHLIPCFQARYLLE